MLDNAKISTDYAKIMPEILSKKYIRKAIRLVLSQKVDQNYAENCVR